ncbi:MAG: adenosine deaminase family protein [Acidobacteria bacterium]|nr:adenosine deaminase family protein [Acidobacteriota bacterium]
MESFIAGLEKAELHIHLEGSIEPETMVELDGSLSLEEVRRHYEYGDFLGFLKAYVWANQRLRGPADYALITRRLLERLARENVRYAEINLSVGVMLWREQDPGRIFEAVARAAEGSPLKVRWVFDAVRQWGAGHAMEVARLAAERTAEGVIGFGVGGDEARGPIEWFAEAFDFARGRGLHILPHAGETTGPEAVWGAVKLGAERIGHGIRAADDPELMAYLREHDIPLEVCVSSNVLTGAVESLASHPLRKLFDAGVPIVLNTER